MFRLYTILRFCDASTQILYTLVPKDIPTFSLLYTVKDRNFVIIALLLQSICILILLYSTGLLLFIDDLET